MLESVRRRRNAACCMSSIHLLIMSIWPNDARYNSPMLSRGRAGKDTVQILAHLQAAYPEAATPQQEALHDLLGPTNERITASAISLLATGDAQGLGALEVGRYIGPHAIELQERSCLNNMHATAD